MIQVRECTSIEDYDACIALQREVFGFPDLEVSPRRHLIVTRRAGGFTLGAFDDSRLVGFVHQMVAVRAACEIIGYSHMTAVKAEYQNRGVGALLKWSQRTKSLEEGKRFITWTWDPMQARNAHFNLNRLGVTASSYGANFYGTGYTTSAQTAEAASDIDTDRLFAEWDLSSPLVARLAQGRSEQASLGAPARTIEIPADWNALVRRDALEAKLEQARVRIEFENAFTAGLVCAAFQRDALRPRYLLYERDGLKSSD